MTRRHLGLAGLAELAISAPRRVITAAILVAIAAAIFGLPVAKSLSAGGGTDPDAQSTRASELLTQKFGLGELDLLFTVTSPHGANSPTARAVAADIVAALRDSPQVNDVRSAWQARPDAARAMISADGRAGLISAELSGGETEAQRSAAQLAERIGSGRDGVVVRAGGEALVYQQVNTQTRTDLLVMEALALPLSFLVLVWVFGGLVAAALPVAVGVFAILGAMASLRGIALFTDVSVFALNLCIAMGMALAVDYTLLLLSRYRDELADHPADDLEVRRAAVRRTMATAGRTVLISATTVALSMATLVLFPQYFLKSFGYAGVAVVAFAATAALVVAPAAIMLLGPRLDAADVRPGLRRLLWGVQPRAVRPDFWSRFSVAVMRRAAPVAIAVTALLLLLGVPFLDARWGFVDDRVLPSTASARQVGDQIRAEFPAAVIPSVTVVLPDATGLRPAELNSYAAMLSKVPQVAAVSAPGGRFVDGITRGPPSAPTGMQEGSAFLTVTSTAPLYSTASTTQLGDLRAVPAPGSRSVWLTGVAASNQDSVEAIAARLPMVLLGIAVITLIMVFLVTRSVVLPVKALIMNTLSLTATFGAIVWIFQQGHLGGLGTEATGTLGVQLPVLLFCIAFGLSMDYEIFLLARIREYWLSTPSTDPHRNERAVSLGVAHTGLVITAAALIMAISFAALMAAQVSMMRLFGFGLTVAVLLDATLVRMVLVPAFMRLLGRANWWAPGPLVRVHRMLLPDGACESSGASELRSTSKRG